MTTTADALEQVAPADVLTDDLPAEVLDAITTVWAEIIVSAYLDEQREAAEKTHRDETP